jgi:AmmeMemoRadiSam system protein B
MIQIREPAVAGHFYPAGCGDLAAAIRAMLPENRAPSSQAPKALIVPHAGYLYSGTVAASAYAHLWAWRRHYQRVVLIGPGHTLGFRGLAASGAERFRSPLGEVELDTAAISSLGHPDVLVSDEAHRHEHSLEVQLPFLQSVLSGFRIVPLLTGQVDAKTVARVIERLWGGTETLIVVSSDLSHYLSYEDARRRDRATCSAIEGGDFHAIGPGDACGSVAVAGLLIAARRHGLEILTLDLRNSGDTAGSRDRVVGYGAWMLRAKAAPP